jgi:hypothetical protein
MSRRAASLAAAVVLAAAPLPAAAAPILSTGGPTFVSFVGSVDPLLRTELWFFGSANPGPDQTPFDSHSGLFLFANMGPQTSAAPGSGGVAAIGSGTVDLNPGGIFAAGTELHFGIFVQDLYAVGAENPNAPGSRGAWFYTGSGAQNFDGRIHAIATQVGPTTYNVGFENLCRTGDLASTDPLCYNTVAPVDFDFDDLMITVGATPTSTVPEPGTWALLGTGLLALGGVARGRRGRTA